MIHGYQSLDRSLWVREVALYVENQSSPIAYRSSGTNAALQAFGTVMKGVENSLPLAEPSSQDWRDFWEDEFLQFTMCCLDLRKIVENRVKIGGLLLGSRVKTRSTRGLRFSRRRY